MAVWVSMMYLGWLVKWSVKFPFWIFSFQLRSLMFLWCLFFFFQAEDGIRDKLVTGVQTCALPILWRGWYVPSVRMGFGMARISPRPDGKSKCSETRLARRPLGRKATKAAAPAADGSRSEERRVGKEGRSRWSPYH